MAEPARVTTRHELPDGREIVLMEGDITTVEADVIGNAANSGLRGGGGVDGAIHRAAGPALMEECRRIGGCPTGSAVLTGAGRLKARYVAHAVGPIWRGGNSGEPEALRSAYTKCLELAEEKGCASIALPSISTGVYGYPVEEAARIALETALSFLANRARSLSKVAFVLFTPRTREIFEKTLANLVEAGAGK